MRKVIRAPLAAFSVQTYWLVVASDDQVFVPPSSHCALIERMDDTHVRHLLESQQTALMKLHAITAIWPNTNHSPDDKCNLKETGLLFTRHTLDTHGRKQG